MTMTACRYPVTGEITYGLERLAMYLQGVDSVYDLVWADGPFGKVTYGDVFHQNEVEQSTYNFEHANVDKLFDLFDFYESEAKRLIELDQPLPLPSYEMVLKASHTFNPVHEISARAGEADHGPAKVNIIQNDTKLNQAL